MTITRKTTCFSTYWPSSGFLQENLRSYYIYCACMWWRDLYIWTTGLPADTTPIRKKEEEHASS